MDGKFSSFANNIDRFGFLTFNLQYIRPLCLAYKGHDNIKCSINFSFTPYNDTFKNYKNQQLFKYTKSKA